MANKISLAACVIWYNPILEADIVKNIESYSSFVEKVYIVDNSRDNNIHLTKSIQNAVYIPLKANTGIAHALNVGLGLALNDGYKWCMTMDQDSKWEVSEISKHIAQLPPEPESRIKSIYPIISTPVIHSKLGNLKAKVSYKNLKVQRITQPNDRWQCSGNIINLETWAAIGKFNEKLFIDEVDFDFCMKFTLNGYKSLSSNAILNHQTESIRNVSSIFGLRLTLSDARVFYKIRNRLYMCHTYPDYAKKYSYAKRLRALALRYFFFGGDSKKNISQRYRLLKSAYKTAVETY